jgi:ribosomal peptide maturation radical SAM protein 1
MLGKELDINNEIKVDYTHFFESLDTHLPDSDIEPTIMFETSRGCWWGERAHCTFCGLNSESMNYRAMQAKQAIATINQTLENYPRCKRFDCVDNIAPKNYFSDVFPHIHPEKDCEIFYEVRSNLTDQDLETLSDARIVKIQPGIESLSTSTLKLMKKGTSAINNILFLKNCLLHGIKPYWNILIGFPGELESTLEKYVTDIPLLTHLPPPTGTFPVRFDRYSPYFENAEEYGLKLRPYNFYYLTYPFDEESITNTAYYFLDHNGSAPYMINLARWYNKIRINVDKWITQWNNEQTDILPRLYLTLENDTYYIHDSRNGRSNKYQASKLSVKILEIAQKPATAKTVIAEIDEVESKEIENEIDFLAEKKLIYTENDKFISLVTPEFIPQQG